MTTKNKDWRANVRNHDTLYDLDPLEVMVLLRHQYLESAKDLLSPKRTGEDVEYGLRFAKIAELLQDAIEVQFGETINVRLEPA